MSGSSMKEEVFPSPSRPKWLKVAYGGMQPGYADNYTDETFLEEMVMNANVVKMDLLKVMLNSVSMSQYLSVVALVVLGWMYTLDATLDENTLLVVDVGLLGLGFLVLLATEEIFASRFFHYMVKVGLFAAGLYLLSPIYQTLTRWISSDSIWAVTTSLLILHLFLHDYSGSTIIASGSHKNPSLTSCILLNSSIIASVFIASRLPSRLHVFAVLLFSLQIFLFAPLVTFCVKKYSSQMLMAVALVLVYGFHRLFFVFVLSLFVFVTVVFPYWLIRIREYKFEINGHWDEAKFCFDITE